MRGGGNNFGIVTHFDLSAFPLTQAWGGYNFYLLSDIKSRLLSLGLPPTPFKITPLANLSSLIFKKISKTANWVACKLGYCITTDQWLNAFLSILEREKLDLDAQLIASLAYIPDLDIYMAFAMPMYAKPVAEPPVFDEVKKLPYVHSTNRIANFSSFHKELDSWSPGGYRFVPISSSPCSHRSNQAFLSFGGHLV